MILPEPSIVQRDHKIRPKRRNKEDFKIKLHKWQKSDLNYDRDFDSFRPKSVSKIITKA